MVYLVPYIVAVLKLYIIISRRNEIVCSKRDHKKYFEWFVIFTGKGITESIMNKKQKSANKIAQH